MEKVKTVDWTEACKQSCESNGDGQFLRLKTGNSYRVRFISKPYSFYRVFRELDGRIYTAICNEEMTLNLPPRIKPVTRFAAYAIDRSDSKIKILEGPISVFRPVGIHTSITEQKPEDPLRGSDYMIKVTGTGIRTRYGVAPVKETPLTQSERASIGSMDMEGNLTKLFKSQSLEEIKQQLKL
jgi:hypothetical protein